MIGWGWSDLTEVDGTPGVKIMYISVMDRDLYRWNCQKEIRKYIEDLNVQFTRLF